MNMKEKETPDELLKEFFNTSELKNMSEEQVKHWSNIMSSIVELRKLRKENPSDSSMGTWILFMMMALPIDAMNLKSIVGNENN